MRRRFGGTSINEKLAGKNMSKANGTIFKKTNILFNVCFCLGKYSFSFDTF